MHFDKILHAVSYAVIAGFLAFAAPRLKLSWVFILPVIYGGLMELAQALSPYGRTGSIFDFLANAIGASVLVGTWCLFIGVVGRTRKTT
jgi:VanZ family protein